MPLPKRVLSSSSSDDEVSTNEANMLPLILKKLDEIQTSLEKQAEAISELKAETINITAAIERLAKEVFIIKSEMKKTKTTRLEPGNFLPSKPFETTEEFNLFEERLKNPENYNSLERDFISITAKTPEQFVKRCWVAILSDKCAQHFSWQGTATKKCVQHLTTTAVITSAFKEKFKNDSVVTLEERTKKHFQYAKDRLSKKTKYAPKNK